MTHVSDQLRSLCFAGRVTVINQILRKYSLKNLKYSYKKKFQNTREEKQAKKKIKLPLNKGRKRENQQPRNHNVTESVGCGWRTPYLGKPSLNNLEEKYKIKICKTRQKSKVTQTCSGNFKYQEIALFSSANKTFSSWRNGYILRKIIN